MLDGLHDTPLVDASEGNGQNVKSPDYNFSL